MTAITMDTRINKTGRKLKEMNQQSCEFLILGSAQGQAGCGLEQPGMVEAALPMAGGGMSFFKITCVHTPENGQSRSVYN